MILKSPWPDVFWRFIVILAISLVLGLLFDNYSFGLLCGAIAILFFQYRNLYRLDTWLRKSRRFTPPEAQGVWGSIFFELERRRKRERKRNKRIFKMLKRFEKSALALPDAAVGMTKDLEMEWWNDSAEVMLGLVWPKDKGQRIINIVRNPRFIQFINRKGIDGSIEFPSPVNETLILEARLVNYGDKEKMLIVRDVSEAKRVQQMRRDFVANVSHELRTPLTVLRGTAEMLDDAKQNLPDNMHRSVDLMLQQTFRMNSLVEDLLSLSKIESSKPISSTSTINLALLTGELHAEAVALSDQRHFFLLEVSPEFELFGNASELRSAFGNLISNAVRYTPEGGKICIRTYMRNEFAIFEVEDSGIGIPAEHVPRLTERFYRVDVGRSRNSGGTGLGLAIVKHVLYRHHATLEIESVENQGSKFRCVFGPKWYRIHDQEEEASPSA